MVAPVVIAGALLVLVSVVASVAAFATRAGSDPATVAATAVGDPNATYVADQAVDIEWHGSWYAGRIKQVGDGEYLIGYDGYGASWDEWVGPTRLRPRSAPPVATTASSAVATTASPAAPGDPNTTYRMNEKVDIEWRGSWYAGRIKKVRDGEYFIGYDGYDASWDEWVGPTRLRPR